MIPLNHLTIIPQDEMHRAVGLAFLVPPGFLARIPLVSFTDRGELPEIATYLYEQVMYLYHNWDRFDQGDVPDSGQFTPIPDVFLREFENGRENPESTT